jgi:D-3-phosphoglycerate dehydrogenase
VNEIAIDRHLPERLMPDPVDALLVDLVEWVAREDRDYFDVMEAWRTSCPRLPVWEEANARGFVTRVYESGRGPMVAVTQEGRAFLAERTTRKVNETCAR